MKTKKDIFKCHICGYEVNVCSLSTMNAATHHFNVCTGKNYHLHIDKFCKLKGNNLTDSELWIAYDLFWGN